MSRYLGVRFVSIIAVLLLSFAMAATASARPAPPPPTPPAPSNDSVTTPSQIRGVFYSRSQDVSGATSAATDPDCDSGNYTAIDGHSVWHELNVATSQMIQVDTYGSDYDTVLSVYRVDGTGRTGITLTQIACNDDDFGVQSAVQFTPVVGVRYLILTAAFDDDDAGTLVLNVNPFTPV